MNRKLRPQTARPKMQGNLAPSYCPKDLLVSEGVMDIFANKSRAMLLDKRPRSAHADISANQVLKGSVHKNEFDDYSSESSLFPLRLDAVPKRPIRCEASKNCDFKEIEDSWKLENKHTGIEPVSGVHNPTSRAAASTRDVAIFPTSANFHPIPPPPQFENPNPRRRFVQICENVPQQNQEKFASRATILKELQPALSSISKLCLEPHLGKIAIRVQSIALVLARCTACCVSLYDAAQHTLQPVLPVESERTLSIPPLLARGVSELVVRSCSSLRVVDLLTHPQFDQACDLGTDAMRKNAARSNTKRSAHDAVHYLAVPGLGPSGEVVCVISALRTGGDAAPFAPDDEALLTLVAQHAGMAIKNSADLRELLASRRQAKVLTSAAVKMNGSGVASDLGQLACLAASYAKSLGDCEDAHIYLTSRSGATVRTWEVVRHQCGTEAAPPEPHATACECRELAGLAVPRAFKAVVSSGAVVNVLVPNRSGLERHSFDARGEGEHAGPASGIPGQPDQIVTIVLGGALRIPPDSDSILVVPLQVERGAPVIGFLKAVNRSGGPRRAGKHGVFSQRDESNLRDLAYITAAAILRQEASRSTSKFMSSIPSIALLRDEESAAKALEGLVQSAMNSDDVYAFMLDGERDFVCHTPTKHNKTLSQSMKLTYKTYPLSIAAERECVHIVDLKMVSEKILARNPFQTDALMRSASAMAVCGIRSSNGVLFGVILVVNARERSFSDASMALFSEICSLTGSVLASSVTFQRSGVISSDMHSASREMLDIANQREVEALFLHVATRINQYMNCSRAVLYLVDHTKNVLWTALESGTVITTELKENVTLEGGSIRTGFANIAASQAGYVNIKDFAHGHRAYNDLLDSADIAHVEKVNRLQPGRINTDSSILQSRCSISSQAESLDADEATESVAALAIRAKASSEVIAVIQVMNKWKIVGQDKQRLNRSGFDEDDLSKLVLLSESISSALQTCGVLSRRWQSEIELRILCEYAAKGQSICIGACSRIHLDDALSFVARAGAAECDATQVAVFLTAGDDSDQMNIIRFEGRLLLPTKPVRAPVSGIAGLTLRSGQLQNVANCRLHPKFEPLIDGKKFIPVESMLACPIRSPAGDLIGVLAFQNKRAKTSLGEAEESTDPLAAHGPHAARKRSALAGHSEKGWGSFGPNDETIINAAVSGLAVAIAQHDLLNQASAVTQRLMDLSRDIEEPDRLFAHIAEASARICRAERCLIFMLDESDEVVGPRWMRAVGVGAPSLVLPSSLGVAGSVVMTGGIANLRNRNDIKPLVDAAEAMAAGETLASCPGATKDANEIMASVLRYAGMLRGLHSAMALPLVLHNGRVTGVMELANKRGGGGSGFTSADERALLLLASHARSMLGHSAAHAAAAARHRAQRATLRCVSDLAQQVASAFARNGNVAEAYSRMVRAACQVLGVVRGRIHLFSPGSNRRLITYDEDGRTVGSGARPSAAVSAVLDLGILVNTTAAAVPLSPMSPGSDSGADRASASVAEVYTGASTGADPSLAVQPRAEADRRLLCAPIADKGLGVWRGAGRDPGATAAGRRAVLGVLEVEAEEVGRVWRGEDEEALMHVAGVAGSLLDVMRNLRPPHPALAVSSGRRRSLVFEAELQAL